MRLGTRLGEGEGRSLCGVMMSHVWVRLLQGHQGEVWCLAVSHDGDTVVSECSHGSCSLYVTAVHHHWQVSGSHDFSLRLWGRTQEPLVLSEERENVS